MIKKVLFKLPVSNLTFLHDVSGPLNIPFAITTLFHHRMKYISNIKEDNKETKVEQ